MGVKLTCMAWFKIEEAVEAEREKGKQRGVLVNRERQTDRQRDTLKHEK